MGKVNCKFFQGEAFGYSFCSKRGSIVPGMCSRCSERVSKSKYNNEKTIVDNIRFDSKKESLRWLELKLLEKDGVIKNLERQKRFQIVPKTKGERAVFYQADFVYEQDGKLICEDTKSSITKKNPTYIIKRKLFKYLFPEYEFRES
ncbi:MAG: DUF1064 domain-containing protein [Treponema sp.]|nr:DUF1064 domain-containing protein [Treponema sp.]